MPASNHQTFTQLLLLEIRRHLEHLAACGNIPNEHRDAYYAASREIRKNTPMFVKDAIRKFDWQKKASEHEEAARGS